MATTLKLNARVTDQGQNREIELSPGSQAQEAGVYQIRDGFTFRLSSDHPDYDAYVNGQSYDVVINP